MKELSIEEKAKAYDEALKVAVAAHKDEDKHLKATLERIFPELKESEDDRIRKKLIECFTNYKQTGGYGFYGIETNNLIAWLEKQGKSKKYIFKSIPRLLDMIEPTERAKAYTKKLINTLTEEGYITDAKIVEECLKQMNGEHVAMAVMDEKRGEQKLANSYCQEHCKGFQETGKCFADGDCKAKTTYKDEPKEDNRPVTERIKTFTDACEVLGDEHSFVTQYRFTAAAYKDVPMTEDFIAYLKLRIIVAALNEGWEPKFEKCEYRYYPWFYLYTKEQYDELDDEKKGRCVLRSGNNTFSYYGVVYCFANVDASSSFTVNSSRLALRSHELAEYAGKQFIEEWADFVFKSK